MRSIRTVSQDQPGRFGVSYTVSAEKTVLSVQRIIRIPDEQTARRFQDRGVALFLGGPLTGPYGDGWDIMISADHDGRVFESSDQAHQFALEHGYVRPYFTSRELRNRRVKRAERPINV